MALVFRALAFRYNRKTEVFAGLDLQIDSPATVLLGPNGAGKSTLMALAASQLAPTQGSLSWLGLSPDSRKNQARYRKAVAWIPQQIRPVPGLTVREQVAYAGWLKGLSRTAAWEASGQALERVDLVKLADRKSHEVSGGQLRRMGIAGALTHRSELILMDEPTAGLDPQQRIVFRSLVEELSDSLQVVVSTHQTEDLADLYREVVVLSDGAVRFQGTTDAFHSLAGGTGSAQGLADAAYAQLVGREV
ncbi:ATP-binding cassette domain-containing protein [Streptomyces sp. HNM0663]|uniref:ATP-binding cassette domain-containing protein n=1 Tax=Streptomyces chengmaiensis TaxID=3040919 RepID=A0ABT6HSI5_9ACTN|nr:ATP-binding cassette domain-containing protein [Streptomyces chengmaiensis]MDH2391550.1 ATP-binding cassette domain-containing protein [Streptomyces chengmaiensis]